MWIDKPSVTLIDRYRTVVHRTRIACFCDYTAYWWITTTWVYFLGYVMYNAFYLCLNSYSPFNICQKYDVSKVLVSAAGIAKQCHTDVCLATVRLIYISTLEILSPSHQSSVTTWNTTKSQYLFACLCSIDNFKLGADLNRDVYTRKLFMAILRE